MIKTWKDATALLCTFTCLIMLSSMRVSADEADHPKYIRAPEGQKIQGEYLVLLNEDRLWTDKMLQDSIESMNVEGGIIAKRVFPEISAVQILVDASKGIGDSDDSKRIWLLRHLLDSAVVETVEDDQLMTEIQQIQTSPPWGLDRIDEVNLPLDNIYGYTRDGSGVTAYVIDSGVRTTHQDFGGRAICGFNSISGDSSSCDDQTGHGTHVAGTLGGFRSGVAKSVDIVAVKVLGEDGSGSNSAVIQGVAYVIQQARLASGPKVANLSLGGGISAALDRAVNVLSDNGVTVVVAAGNENQNACGVSPARATEVITVGATQVQNQIRDVRSSFSNFGECVDISAPGSEITSSWNRNDNDFNTISGTSMASPHVAGAAALYLQARPDATPVEVQFALERSALVNQISNSNGSPNLLLHVTALFDDVEVEDMSSSSDSIGDVETPDVMSGIEDEGSQIENETSTSAASCIFLGTVFSAAVVFVPFFW